MKIYRCIRCGAEYDFATQAPGRLCDICGAPLVYQGAEDSPWGEHPIRDYDATPCLDKCVYSGNETGHRDGASWCARKGAWTRTGQHCEGFKERRDSA